MAVPGGHVARGTPKRDSTGPEPSSGTTKRLLFVVLFPVEGMYTLPWTPSPDKLTPIHSALVAGMASHITVTGMFLGATSRGGHTRVPAAGAKCTPAVAEPLVRT
jgi:hypothetical protein